MVITDDEYEMYSPLSAYLDDKDDAQQDAVYFRFGNLSDAEKQVLAGVEAAEAVAGLISTGTLPQNYGKAVAKLIYLVLDGEVKPAEVGVLLEKLGLSAQQAQQTSSAINTIVAPVFAERASVAPSVQELPPLTTKIPPASTGSTMASRNMIDLRKQQP